MENKDFYSPEEITSMFETHSFIVQTLDDLRTQMNQIKNRLYQTKKKGDVDKLWGHLMRNRYEGTRQSFVKLYESEIPENIRKVFESKGLNKTLKETLE